MSVLNRLRNEFSGFGRILALWVAFESSLGNGIAMVLDVALTNQPVSGISMLVAVGATYIVQWWYPDVRLRTVWAFAITMIFIFFGLILLNPTVIYSRTEGTIYYTVKASLIWIAALSLSCVVVWTKWREVLPIRE
jgi:predicted neutral ceramidase superfamily lipid hydrolase